MLPYQNYYQNYTNPYQIQPNNQQVPALGQQNYIGQQYPATYQQMQMPSILGRVVSNFSEIVANDVPMDGRSAVFPKSDMSEIQVRAWGADGKIRTTTYKPILEGSETDTANTIPNLENVKFELSSDVKSMFEQRFDELVERLDDMEKNFVKSTRAARAKKEADTE